MRGRPPLPREHGTNRGYHQHKNRGDLPACKPCKDAHTKSTRITRVRDAAVPAVPAAGYARTCPHCLMSFRTQNYAVVYCSRACGQRAIYLKRKAGAL